jgi:Protein of unknown function (DUF3035)
MTGDDRAVERRRRIPLLAVACLSGALLVAGCSDFRQIVGLDTGGPDEFAVETRAPLTIPPDFNLRPPEPGAPRPQEVTAAQRAEQVINTAGPGKPGDQAQVALQVPKGGIFPGERPDPNREVTPDSLASRLLSANDTAAGGAVKRETTPLKGIY